MEMKEFLGPKWLMWRDLAETQEFLKYLKDEVEESKKDWIGGGWVSSDEHQTTANAFRELGLAQAYDRVVFVIENMKLAPETAEKGVKA